ncbi:ABC transporter ATP-binding protein [Maricaulis maris]|uniref:ABC transporter ATP-binding protein n=1 Tax=Maricaulis maris TaxID=74318 RepID=UPI003A8DFA43
MSYALELSKVSKRFRTRKVETLALDQIDLSVERGKFLSIVGSSGSGKSTLVAIMGLLENPSEGSVVFFGETVTRAGSGRLADLRRNHIGFVFQSFQLISDMSVVENVMAGLDGIERSKRLRRARALETLDALGIAHRADHLPSQLSGGQQQRAAVARAMVRKPLLLICDEPTGNLDPESADIVMAHIEAFRDAGATVVLVTHDPAIARRADRIVTLEHGQLQPGPVASP